MDYIKGTNREFLELLKGLENVKGIKGARFGMLVAKNIKELSAHLHPIELEAIPTDEFRLVAHQVHQLAEAEDAEAIAKVEEEHKEVIDARKEQMQKVEEMLDQESEVAIRYIREDQLPSDLTPEQLLPILGIIEEAQVPA